MSQMVRLEKISELERNSEMESKESRLWGETNTKKKSSLSPRRLPHSRGTTQWAEQRTFKKDPEGNRKGRGNGIGKDSKASKTYQENLRQERERQKRDNTLGA